MADALAFSTLGVGLLLGVRHALDGDHLAAISTILAEGRSWKRAAWVGIVWGVGHSAALFVAALVVIFANLRLPELWAGRLEVIVGAIIVALGARLAWRAATGRVHAHEHTHGEVRHVHMHDHAPAAGHHHPLPRASFAVGVVHGLAGSAALMLVVLSTIQSTGMALLYVALFGVGSTVGMGVMSSVMTVPMSLLRGARRQMQVVVGCASVVFGVVYVVNAL